jgi:uncharacterized membrane protein YtjA (UPF0391 family)
LKVVRRRTLSKPGQPGAEQEAGGENMLRWALIFFIVALIAAVFGFWGTAVAAAGIAKLLFVVFVILFLVWFIGGLLERT